MKDISGKSKDIWNTLKARWGIISVLAAVFITGLVIGLLLKSGGGPGETTVSIGTPDRKILLWTCSMHPNIQKQNPGKCPICGMDLIPVKQTEQPNIAQNIYYGCGVKEEGHCPHCDEGKPDAKCICGGNYTVIT